MNAKSDRSGHWHKHLLELKTSWSSLGNNDVTFQPQSVMALPRLTRLLSWLRPWPVSPSWPPPRLWPSTLCWWQSPWPGRGGGGGTWTLWSGARRASALSSRRRSMRCRSGSPWHSVKAVMLVICRCWRNSCRVFQKTRIISNRWEIPGPNVQCPWETTEYCNWLYDGVRVHTADTLYGRWWKLPLLSIPHPPSGSRTCGCQCHGWETCRSVWRVQGSQVGKSFSGSDEIKLSL